MFRIDTHRSGSTRVDIRLSGRLAESEAEQLAAAVSSHLNSARSVHLDLSGLAAVDRDGVSLLLQLTTEGVRLAHCPAFLTLWLRAERQSRNREAS